METCELAYKIGIIPDLGLNKYASLDGAGVGGVIEKNLAFLRQWNRKGLLSDVSFHLFYYYDGQDPTGRCGVGEKGNKLKIMFLVRGAADKLENVDQILLSSPIAPFFRFERTTYAAFLSECNITSLAFPFCASLLKKEVFVRSTLDTRGQDSVYYTVPEWEINEEARLYNMVKLLEALDRQMLYRVDLYPVDRSDAMREELRAPMAVLRERQYAKASMTGQRDFEAENVLRGYEDKLSAIDSSPHFAANIFVYAHNEENAAVVLDAAGAEALAKGRYEIARFAGCFAPNVFLDKETRMYRYKDPHSRMIMEPGDKCMEIFSAEAQQIDLRYLPTLFTLEEAAPFFCFPALYEGEVIQIRKETAPAAVPSKEYTCGSCGAVYKQFSAEDPAPSHCPKCGKETVARQTGLFLGVDDNGYDIYFPLKYLQRHAFVAGVPGSGKTNTLHHLCATLWKTHRIPFLVLEPAKQEYRALLNQKGMEDVYLFSPNADMRFPLHINPFEFPKGLMLSEHIRRLESVFEGAFPMEPPAPFILDAAIEGVYRKKGWSADTVNNGKLKFPTMEDLYEQFEEEIAKTEYDGDMKGSLKSVLQVRIGSLVRREMGDVFNVPVSSVPPEKWLEIPAVIELESMGPGPANFLTLMLCALIREALKVNPLFPAAHARHVIFIEEAHNLIGPESEETSPSEANPKQAATNFIVKMLAEVRALKEGIVIADQLPTVMAPEVIKNTGLKIGLKITSADDRALLCGTMSANGVQMEEMGTFNIGRSLVSYEGLVRPFTMQMHEWCGPYPTALCAEGKDAARCAGCAYFLNGDCLPERRDRARVTSPVADDDALQKLVWDRRVYKETAERSFIVEAAGFYREYVERREVADAVLNHLRKLKKTEALFIRKKRDLEAKARAFAYEDPDWDKKEDKRDAFYADADSIFKEERETMLKLKKSRYFTGAYNAIVECIHLVTDIEIRKTHWIGLGITEFSETVLSADKALTPRMQAVNTVILFQRGLITDAQRVFVMYREYMDQPDETRNMLKKAAKAFHVNVIV